jgi:hypothetical protein
MDNEEKENQIPSMQELCLNVPLYEVIKFNESNVGDINREIRWFRGNFDCYCLECHRDSVFQSNNTQLNTDASYIYLNKINHFTHYFSCTRNPEHKLFYIFQISYPILIKIGQYPSMADLAKMEINKYRRILSDERYKEFSRAVGLASHGVGIGAFVYLRRIFESLIDDAHEMAKKLTGWDDENYIKSRMDEKIASLKDYLPLFLVQNKNLYSILSKGIHLLSEQECLKAFPVVKVGIELILDEKIEEKRKQAKIDEAKKAISSLIVDIK